MSTGSALLQPGNDVGQAGHGMRRVPPVDRPLHLCFLGDYGNPHLQRWARFYVEREHRVSIVTFRPGPDAGAEVHLVRSPIPGKARYLAAAPHVRRLIRRLAPDLVHAHFATSYGLLGALAGHRPLVITGHGSDLLISPRQSRLLRHTVAWSLQQADLVTVASPTLAATVASLTRDQVRPDVFQYGLDLPAWPFRAPRDRFAPLRVVSTRHLHPVYGVETLIRAIPLVRQAGIDVDVVICGDGPLRQDLESLARDLAVTDIVVFRGALPADALAVELAQADVYVSASSSDGLSLSLLEAMAVGLYPIVSDIPANRELIADGYAASLFPVGDAAALATTLIALARQSRATAATVRRNRAVVEARADREAILGRVERRYRALVEGGREQACRSGAC